MNKYPLQGHTRIEKEKGFVYWKNTIEIVMAIFFYAISKERKDLKKPLKNDKQTLCRTNNFNVACI